MKVLNLHKRKINASKALVLELFLTLSTVNDEIWPTDNWPKMKFADGLKLGSKGGHGPIRYEIVKYNPQNSITFRFQKPIGFKGTHEFEITELDKDNTEIKHTIEMTTSSIGTIQWLLGVRWLHDALIEDAFDRVENRLMKKNKRTEWNSWVKVLRAIINLKPKV